MTNAQVYEIAKTLDSMLAMGAPTVAGTKGLNPESLQSKMRLLQQRVQNEPVGADLGAFVSNIRDTIHREKKIADDKTKQFYEMAKNLVPARQYKERQADYDKSISERIKRIGENQFPEAAKSAESGQDIITAANGKKYLVDHATKKVLKEVQ